MTTSRDIPPYIGSDAVPDDRPIVTGAVVPYTDQGAIVMFRHQNGLIEFLGGHVEAGESVEDGVRREAIEEGGVVLEQDLRLIGYLVFDGHRPSYNPLYVGRVARFVPIPQGTESVEGDPKAAALPKEISRLNNALDKVVVSDSLTANDTEPWHNTTIVRRADAYGKIAELKRRPGKDILIFGSRTLWNDLLANNLVDELHVMIAPVAIGAGTPLLQGQSSVSFRLIDTRTWGDSGNVLARYEVRGQDK